MSLKKKILLNLMLPFTLWFLLVSGLTFYGIKTYFSTGNVIYSQANRSDAAINQNLNISTDKLVEVVSLNLKQTTQQFWLYYVIGTLILIIFGIILLYKMIQSVLKPLEDLETRVSHMVLDEFLLPEKSFQECYPTEIASLETSFTELLLNLKSEFEKQGRFIDSAAHELRTPITVIQTALQLLAMDDDKTPTDYDECFEIVETHAKSLAKMIETLLLLSQDISAAEHQELDVKTTLEEVIDTMQWVIPDCQIIIGFSQELSIQMNRELFKSMLYNLLENASKYGADQIKIDIKYAGKFQLMIQDNGNGIPAEKLPFITEAFYRGDDSRNKKIKGYGLGLTIVSDIMEQLNGKLQITSQVDVGTCVCLEFPSYRLVELN